MTIEELQKIDPTFNESMFISKVNNMLKKILTSIMLEKLDDIKHFITSDILNSIYLQNKELWENNRRQMYDELNLNNAKIVNITDDGDSYKITVSIEVRYLDYIIDKNNYNIISGNNNDRKLVMYTLELTKFKTAKDQGIAKKCPTCGASMDVNSSGKCIYCGNTYDQASHDWVITAINS